MFFRAFNDNIYIEKIYKTRFLSSWAKIFKTSTLKDNNIQFLEYIGEDGIFTFTVVLNSKKVTITTIPTYIYYSIEGSMIHKHDVEKFYRHMDGMKKTRDVLKEHNVNLEKMLAESLEHSLLVFSNLNKKDKDKAIKEIYDYEQSLNCKLKVKKFELKYLNNLILNKKFKRAIFISEIYSSLYNNDTIKQIYRDMNNKIR